MICFDLGASIDWTVISSIATAIMAIATFITIYYNRKQINEMRRQWDENNRPELEFNIITSELLHILKITNVGNKIADNVHIRINDEFLDAMLLEEATYTLRNLSKEGKRILPNSSLYYPLSPLQSSFSFQTNKYSYNSDEIQGNTKKLLYIPLKITGSYNGNYTINETFVINDCLGPLIVDNPIETSLAGINESIRHINLTLRNERFMKRMLKKTKEPEH